MMYTLIKFCREGDNMTKKRHVSRTWWVITCFVMYWIFNFTKKKKRRPCVN